MVVKDDKIHRAKSVTHAGRMPGTRTVIEVLNAYLYTLGFDTLIYLLKNNNNDIFRETCKFYVLNYFLAHLAKGNVSFCHHLAFFIRRPLTW